MDLNDPGVSVLLTGDDAIEQLNERWRGIDEPTDVLSFPSHSPAEFPDDPDHLGDIAINIPCGERLVASQDHHRRVASQLGVDPDEITWTLHDELLFLFVHGLLHLVGYDHDRPDRQRKMKDMERRLWELLTT